jgi:hypothetical protein
MIQRAIAGISASRCDAPAGLVIFMAGGLAAGSGRSWPYSRRSSSLRGKAPPGAEPGRTGSRRARRSCATATSPTGSIGRCPCCPTGPDGAPRKPASAPRPPNAPSPPPAPRQPSWPARHAPSPKTTPHSAGQSSEQLPWILTTPHRVFSRARRRIRATSSSGTGGRPGGLGWRHLAATSRRCQRLSAPESRSAGRAALRA